MLSSLANGARREFVDVESCGLPLRVSAIGFGPRDRDVDVVFLHANGFNARTYREALEPLGSGLRVLAVDQRGHGRTAQGRSAANRRDILDLRDDLIALLEALGSAAPPVLAGHSLGGCVALLAAAERPALARNLALFDPAILSRDMIRQLSDRAGTLDPEPEIVRRARVRRQFFPSHEAAFETYSRRGAFADWPPATLRDYIADGFFTRPDGQIQLACSPDWEASNFLAHTHDVWADMRRLSTPLSILRAEAGSTCTVATADAFPGRVSRLSIETVAGSDHFLPMTLPHLVREGLQRAVADHG